MKIVVGLGNPGETYRHTRHNIGWRVLDALAHGFSHEKKFRAMVEKHDGVLYVKPLTFMNNSGEAVRALMEYYNVGAENVTAVYDDVDLPFGIVRLRSEGSAGGHNGVKSLMQHLGTDRFARVRVGVQGARKAKDTATYVLKPFTVEEEAVMNNIIEAAARGVRRVLREGISKKTHADIQVEL